MIAMETLTVLLAIRIVANNLFGFERISKIRRFAPVFSVRIFSSCVGESEKKATSEAEKTADRNNNPRIIKI